MATITPAATFPVTGSFNTTPPYSGTFIPTLWSAKLNAKFYKQTVFSEIANTDYEGEIKDLGDKVIINNIPSISINDYQAGAGLTYEVPTPNTVELPIDKGKYFAFQVNDVLAYQSRPNLIDTFSDDAAQQMQIAIDSTVLFNTYPDAAAANVGTAAGVRSGKYDLGDDSNPVALTATNVLSLILSMGSVLDEQNIPNTDRWLIIDPVTRMLLLESDLKQVQITGDATSPLRNGKIGTIDRFTVYVSNNLPTGVQGDGTNAGTWTSGDGTETRPSAVAGTSQPIRLLMAGHKAAITFASQLTKVEPVRNPNDFGDFVRGLNVFGFKVIKPEALTYAVVT